MPDPKEMLLQREEEGREALPHSHPPGRRSQWSRELEGREAKETILATP